MTGGVSFWLSLPTSQMCIVQAAVALQGSSTPPPDTPSPGNMRGLGLKHWHFPVTAGWKAWWQLIGVGVAVGGAVVSCILHMLQHE